LASQEGALCALDILAASGLLNYFGKMELPSEWNADDTTTQTGLEVKPVLLQKGDTKLALYGMGNIRDERFHAQMRARQIVLFKPAENPEEWFNIILVHQNRSVAWQSVAVAHTEGLTWSSFVSGFRTGPTTSRVTTLLERRLTWLCGVTSMTASTRPGPNQSLDGGTTFLSLGAVSPPASQQERQFQSKRTIRSRIKLASPKLTTRLDRFRHVALIKIQGKEFEFEPIRLRSVRPFIFEDLNLMDEQANGAVLKTKVQVNKFLKAKVNALIDRANAEWDALHADDDHDQPEPMLPLIRLRVDYSGGPDEHKGFEVGNPQRFGQDFQNTVANPRDIVSFHRKSQATRKSKVTIDQPNLQGTGVDAEDDDSRQSKIKIGDLVVKYLKAQELKMLPEKFMQDAVENFVDKGDKGALAE